MNLYDYLKKIQNNTNANTLCVGYGGAGKTVFFIEPSITQMSGSYVIIDNNGYLYKKHAETLKNNGYETELLDLSEVSKTESKYMVKYNPFKYIHTVEDIQNIVAAFIVNAKSYDPLWGNAVQTCLQMIMTHIWMDMPKQQHNMETVKNYLEKGVDGLDEEFSELEQVKGKDYLPCKLYSVFVMGTERMRQSVLISLAVQLQYMLQKTDSTDTLNLETLGKKKKALFIKMSTINAEYDFLATMLCYQAIREIMYQSENNKREPVHVRFLLDEFVRLNKIPYFKELLSELQKYNMSVAICVHYIAELKYQYPDTYDSIINLCGVKLFMGGSDQDTVDLFSKISINAMKQEPVTHQLFTPDELFRMPYDKCLLKVREFESIIINKQDLTHVLGNR